MSLNLREGLDAKRVEGGQRPADVPMQEMSAINFTPRSDFEGTQDYMSDPGRSCNDGQQEMAAVPEEPHRRNRRSGEFLFQAPVL
jgi:hypothetical protein